MWGEWVARPQSSRIFPDMSGFGKSIYLWLGYEGEMCKSPYRAIPLNENSLALLSSFILVCVTRSSLSTSHINLGEVMMWSLKYKLLIVVFHILLIGFSSASHIDEKLLPPIASHWALTYFSWIFYCLLKCFSMWFVFSQHVDQMEKK